MYNTLMSLTVNSWSIYFIQQIELADEDSETVWSAA